MTEAESIRERGRRIAEAKAVLERLAIERHMALPPGERLRLTIELSAAHLEACPPDPALPDDEAEIWARVNRHLASVR